MSIIRRFFNWLKYIWRMITDRPFRLWEDWEGLIRRLKKAVFWLICGIIPLLIILIWDPLLRTIDRYPNRIQLLSTLIIAGITLTYVFLTRKMAKTMQEEFKLRMGLHPVVKSKWDYHAPIVGMNEGEQVLGDPREGEMVVEIRIWNYSQFPIWIHEVGMRAMSYPFEEDAKWDVEIYHGQQHQIGPGACYRLQPPFKFTGSDFAPDQSTLPPKREMAGEILVHMSIERNTPCNRWLSRKWDLEYFPSKAFPDPDSF